MIDTNKLPAGIIAGPKGISVKGLTILKDNNDQSPVVRTYYKNSGGQVWLNNLHIIGVDTSGWNYKLAMRLLRGKK